MRIDLHTHSAVSDGTDRPADLVAKAAASGLDVMALTDHDTSEGWDEAQQAADQHGIRLIKGMELSTSALRHGLHLLAYEPDPNQGGLGLVLGRGRLSRDGRTGEIIALLDALGLHISAEDVARHSGGGTAGRPHIADALVEAGYVTDRDEAFEMYLKRGRPASVMRWQPDVGDAVLTVLGAGGTPVLAHPWGRGSDVDEKEFARLKALGLAGIEVDHQEHDAAARDGLRAIARNLDLIVTGSSDHHGLGKVGHDLGCNTTAPEQFERLVEVIETNRSTYAAREAERLAREQVLRPW